MKFEWDENKRLENIKKHKIDFKEIIENMSKDSITKKYFKENTPDSEIDTSDIPPLDKDFWDNARLRYREPKTPISIRLDPKVLEFFKSQGKGYQKRINAVLRAYVEHQQRA